MGDFYDLALRRARQITQLRADNADLRAELDARDRTIEELHEVIAAQMRTIDLLEQSTWRPHH